MVLAYCLGGGDCEVRCFPRFELPQVDADNSWEMSDRTIKMMMIELKNNECGAFLTGGGWLVVNDELEL